MRRRIRRVLSQYSLSRADARSSAGGILEIYIFSGPIRAAGVIINNRQHAGDDRGLSARGAHDADDRNDVFIIHVQVAVPLLSHGVSSEELSVLKVI